MLFKFCIYIFHVFKDKFYPQCFKALYYFSPSKRVSLLFKLSVLYCLKYLN